MKNYETRDSTIYGMIDKIMFESDTLEQQHVIKRKQLAWKISEVPDKMMVWYDTMTTIRSWRKKLKWPKNILAIKNVSM